MEQSNRDIVRFVVEHPGASIGTLADFFGVKTRMAYERLRKCNDSLGDVAAIAFCRNGAHGAGYYMNVCDEDAFKAWLHVEVRPSALPQNPQDRVVYLLNDLLSRNTWVTLDDLSSVLFVSRATLSGDLREVEKRLQSFDLTLERRPRYGIRVCGSEVSRRLCLASTTVNSIEETAQAPVRAQESFPVKMVDAGLDIEAIQSCVADVLDSENFQINSFTWRNLIVHIGIALRRIKEGCYVPVESDRLVEMSGTHEFKVAEKLSCTINEKFSIELPRQEIAYLAMHLAGKQMLFAGSSSDSQGIVISDEIWDLVAHMLELVWRLFKFDFRSDIELRMNLARHIVPLSTRLKNHLAMENPILGEIKDRYPLAYSIAVEATSVLEKQYGTSLSDAEIGYIALAFALALERQKQAAPKKNIVIFCASGRGTAKLLEYRYRSEFGDHIGRIDVYDISRVDHIDYAQVDYAFTTVPIGHELPVPVRQVEVFLSDQDISNVRKLILEGDESANVDDISKYLSPDLYFPHCSAKTREEVIEMLCDEIGRVRIVDATFRELVFKREDIAPTAFGNRLALPHPFEPASDETFLTVALLDEPIAWGNQVAQVIFLLSVSKHSRKGLEVFYDRLSDVLLDVEAIDVLLADRRFETLVAVLAGGVRGTES